MKLNFWQWLGVVLLVLWAFLYFRRPAEKTVDPVPSQPPTSTQPSTTQPSSSPAAP
ncbi:MAG: hypothetical protein JWO31_1570 [Phycisphaerales bacterium]|nr:hypothetical protein [Phycisphaerales bacterium]